MHEHGPFVERYLENTYKTIESALSQYPRVFATRFDLMLPVDMQNWPSSIISRFLDHFKAIVESHLRSLGMKPEKCLPRIVWAKERYKSMNPHYHALLLLNNDVFHMSGRLGSDNLNLISRIQSSWAKALGLTFKEAQGLVNFPPNRDYKLDRNSSDFHLQLEALFHRVSYLAKEKTKNYGDGTRYFSCSQNSRLVNGFDLEAQINKNLDGVAQNRDEGLMTDGGLK